MHYGLFLTLFFAVLPPAFAQTTAEIDKASTTVQNLPESNTALIALQEQEAKESAELDALQAKAIELRKNYQQEAAVIQKQMNEVRNKYSTKKYELMEKADPGSGAKLSKKKQAAKEAEAERTKALQAIAADQKAEAEKGALSDDAKAKYQAARKAVFESFRSKMNKIREEK